MAMDADSAKLIKNLISGRLAPGEPVTDRSVRNSLAGTLSDLIDVMDIAMWQLDLEYRVVGYNQKAKRIYGEHALGDHCYRVAAKEDQVCKVCPARMVYEGSDSGRSQHRRTDVHGNVIYIDHIATPIKDEAGRTTGSLVLIIDITKQKLQEEELRRHREQLEEMVKARTRAMEDSQERYQALYEESRQAEKLYRSLLNSSADAIAIYNLSGEVQYISPSFTEIFGWQLDELKGRQIPFVPEAEKASSIAEIRRLLDTGVPTRNFQTRRLTKDGRLLDIYISASKYEDNDGNPMGILVFLKDVTEAKSMEMQLYRTQKIEALATLAGGIAHDFNNLLMGIQGHISLLQIECEKEGRPRDSLAHIEHYVQRGVYLTKQLLGLSREGKYEVKPTDTNKLIQQCAEMFGQTKKEIVIHRNFPGDIWPVEVDRGQIEQVLLNLFVNAGQAMPEGGALRLSTRNVMLDEPAAERHRLPPGRYTQIRVTDTGTGIPEEIIDRVFDPFFTTKIKESGTGLGLASAYGIIKNHGGSIQVESDIGQGTTFTIYLPATPKKVREEKPQSTDLLTGEETILLVDDEDMITEVGRELLETIGYRVMTAASGEEAMAIFQNEKDRIDLVILDMIMPGINGSELFDRLKALKPEIRTLLSSGYSLDGLAAQILERGCNGFIQKPFRLDTLSQKVREVLDTGSPDLAAT